MKEYKKRQRKTDHVQELNANQCGFDIMQPIPEVARLEEDFALEEQIKVKKSSSPEEIDERLLPRPESDERIDHKLFLQWLIALVSLITVLAIAALLGLMK